jgi:8-oxo-dGTP diphosphatase
MNVYLIRHAHAGDRGSGPRDIDRPLSDKGSKRAKELATMFDGASVTRIASSPATRCAQTVQPLAEALGLEIEETPTLWEGSSVEEVLAGLHAPGGGDLVACTHGDIIPELVERVAAEGAVISGRGCEKGSVWVLERRDGAWVQARYVSKKSTALV